MFIVPLIGDTVSTRGRVQHTVLAYNAYGDEPSVVVETDSKSSKIPFSEIEQINGTPVSLSSGKIFVADSLIKRKMQLPQVNDKVFIDGDDARVIKVKSVKLFERGNIASGVQIVGTNNDTQKPEIARLKDVVKIERAQNDSVFTRAGFQKLYKEYLGA